MSSEGRYYEAEFPEMEEIVVVQVKRIVDMGAYVSLLEYDNQEVEGKACRSITPTFQIFPHSQKLHHFVFIYNGTTQ